MTDVPPTAPQANPHERIASEKFRRSRGFWRILAFLALALLVIVAFARFAMPSGNADYVARVVIDGTITSDRARLKMLNDLGEQERVKAVIVAINSPGGTTAGGEELYEALRQLSEKKPTVSVISELGASAAYMTAIATDRIYARRLSIVGSIGVLYQHLNAGKLLETIGVDLDKVASGPLKAEPSYDSAMTGATRQSIAELVDDSFQWFVDVVAERRQIPRRKALALADGRIVTGRIALENQLIDAIGGEAEAREWLAQTHDVDPELVVRTLWPQPKEGFDLLGTFLGSQARLALGLPAQGMALDGLVSLWQVGTAQ
jgi:protease-4